MTTLAAATQATGWLDEVGDQDWFSMNLVAGQRYFLELLGGAFGDQRAQLNLFASNGPALVASAALGGARLDNNGYSFVAPANGSYVVQVQPSTTVVGEKPPLPVPYSIALTSLAADDHADLLIAATTLTLGIEVAARFDLPGDADSFAADLQAGQRVVFEATAMGQTRITFLTQVLGPDGKAQAGYTFASTGSQAKFVFTAPADGVYTTTLMQTGVVSTPAAPGSAGYTVKFSAADADDRPDNVSAALAIGTSVTGVLDLPGDVDRLSVDLVAGKRYLFELSLPQNATLGTEFVGLKLFDAAGTLLRTGAAAPGLFASMVVEPEVSGTYVLSIDAAARLRAASLGPGNYLLATRELAADDHAGRYGAATPIEPDGSTLTLRFDQAGDIDLFRFNALAGQRYLASLATEGGVPATANLFIVPSGSVAALSTALYLGPQDGRAAGRADATAENNSTMALIVTPRPQATVPAVDANSRYVLSLSALGADDHADTKSLGTPLQAGVPQNGKLDLNGDVDWFRAELLAGTRYRFELSISSSDRGRGIQPELELVRLDGSKPSFDSNPAALPESSFVFTSDVTTSYFLSPKQVGAYTLTMTTIGADDQPDLRPGNLLLLPNPTYLARGLEVQGGERAENFVGTPSIDIFMGAGGNDVFFGGAGDDRIDGGAGIDMARFSGTRAEHVWVRAGVGFSVQDQLAGRDGTDLLSGIERIGFIGQTTALALDLDGNAGAVARAVGALFGKGFLANTEIIGIGLDLLDRGTGYADLITLAVGTDLFARLAGSHSNPDFVRLVYTNVVGRAPSPADLSFYTGLLDGGGHTQASLALLAAQTDLNASNVDLVGLSANGLLYQPM